MQNPSKQKTLRKLTAGSLIAVCSLFGTAGLALAAEDGGGGSTPPDEGPGPSLPNIPEDPIGEGLPVPIPGGGG
jgi:hypothetical protein